MPRIRPTTQWAMAWQQKYRRTQPPTMATTAAMVECADCAAHNDVGWSTASSPAIRAWLKRLALATEPSTPWKSGASAPRWQRSVLGFQPCTGPEGHLSCAPECGPKRAALPHRLCCSSRPPSSRLLEQTGLMSRLVWVGHSLRLRSCVWGQPPRLSKPQRGARKSTGASHGRHKNESNARP